MNDAPPSVALTVFYAKYPQRVHPTKDGQADDSVEEKNDCSLKFIHHLSPYALIKLRTLDAYH